MKRLMSLLCCLPILVAAQNKILLVQGTAPGCYLLHTVQPKENYYSIGRLYNLSPKDIAPFNNLSIDKGLNLHQTIKVPLLAGNFVQNKVADADESLVPVYHLVQDKEGLYKISAQYNKVPIDKIKQWNNLRSDAVASGSKLIVGFLKVKTALSALSSGTKTVPEVQQPVEEKPVETQPVVVKEPVKKTPEPKQPTVPEPVKKTPEPQQTPVQEPVKEPVVKTTPTEINVPVNAPVGPGGWFKSEFEKQPSAKAQQEAGTAAIFKSNSGSDGRYYCFHNTAATGSIVKITSNSTGKSVYAKVLDVIPDIKQNTGLVICISNAAAIELGFPSGKFDCNLVYSK